MGDRLPSPVVLGVGVLSNQAFVVPDQVQFGLAADGGQMRTRMEMLSRITGCVPTVKMVDRTEVQGAVRGGDELPFLFDSVHREDQRVFRVHGGLVVEVIGPSSPGQSAMKC